MSSPAKLKASGLVNVPVAMALSSRMHAYAHTYTLNVCRSTLCLSHIHWQSLCPPCALTEPVCPASRLPCFLGPVPQEGLPKDAKPGCTMRGTLALAKTSPLAGDRPAPNAVTLLYAVPPAKKKADEDSSKPDGEEAPLEALKQARRDADVRPRLRLPLSHAVQLCATSMPRSSVPIRSICTLGSARWDAPHAQRP